MGSLLVCYFFCAQTPPHVSPSTLNTTAKNRFGRFSLVSSRLEEQELGAEERLRVSGGGGIDNDNDDDDDGNGHHHDGEEHEKGGGGGGGRSSSRSRGDAADGGGEGQLVVREEVRSPARGVKLLGLLVVVVGATLTGILVGPRVGFGVYCSVRVGWRVAVVW